MSRMAIPFLSALAGLTACTVINEDLLGEQQSGQRDSGVSSGSDAAAEEEDAADLPAIDLAVHYEFEGTGVSVSDSSGRDFHGTLTDLSARTAQGRVVRGVALSGALPATQFVELPDGLLEGIDDFTIAVWVKLDSVGAWSRIYDIGNGLPDPANRFMYLTPSGASGIHAASYGGSAENESTLTTGTQLPTGVWKHLALTGSGGDRTLYIDGFPVASVEDMPDVPPYEMEPIEPQSWLGKSRFAADPGLDGTLDEFRIYGRVLDPDEIADLAWPQDDYSYWRFDGAATDSSDNAVPTALVDGATWTDDGRLGGALDLEGREQESSGPHAVLNENPIAGCTEELTISLWIKLRGFDDGAHAFDFGTTDNTHYMYLAPSDGTGTRFAMRTPAGETLVATETRLFPADDTWHHLAVTINADDLVVLYVDGLVAMTQTSADVELADFADLDENLLGKSRFASDPYLDGSIDELRIACRAFTADEIRNFANR